MEQPLTPRPHFAGSESVAQRTIVYGSTHSPAHIYMTDGTQPLRLDAVVRAVRYVSERRLVLVLTPINIGYKRITAPDLAHGAVQ